MKNLGIAFLGAMLLLQSCGGGSESEESAETLKLDKNDVKGTIDLPGNTKTIPGSLTTNDGSFKYLVIEMEDENELNIFPGGKNYPVEVSKLEQVGTDGKYEKVEIIEKTENYIFYKHSVHPFGKDTPMEELEDGYGFLLKISGDGKEYVITCNGPKIGEPVWQKDAAEKLLKIAQTFKPE
jgi:hypothetical protein